MTARKLLYAPIFVSEEHIRLGERGSTRRSPLALGISEALGVSIAVMQGPSAQPSYDFRSAVSSMEHSCVWHALLAQDLGDGLRVFDVPLPWRAQRFADAWERGARCGPYAALLSGRIVRYTYDQVIRPFSFPLASPFPLDELRGRVPSDAILEFGEVYEH